MSKQLMLSRLTVAVLRGRHIAPGYMQTGSGWLALIPTGSNGKTENSSPEPSPTEAHNPKHAAQQNVFTSLLLSQ